MTSAVVVIFNSTTGTHGAPLTGSDMKQMLPHYIRADCFRLMDLVSRTHNEFAEERFKNRNYDHYIELQGVEPLIDYASLSKEEFLRKQLMLLYTFTSLIRETIDNEAKNHGHDNFKDKFQEILNQVYDLISNLRQMERMFNFKVTNVGHVTHPTMKPQVTQKEQDEWALIVLKDLLLSLVPLQRGAAETLTQ